MKVVRVPGLAIHYCKHLHSAPDSFKYSLLKTPVLHETVVFLTVRQVSPPDSIVKADHAQLP